MKKLALFAALLMMASCATNRTKTVSNISTIDGIWQWSTVKEVKLYEVQNGKHTKIASAMPNAGGHFTFSFTPAAPAFYVVGTNDVAPSRNFTFWFKPGDRLEFTVVEGSYILRGRNTPENVEITRWHDWVSPLEKKTFYRNLDNSSWADFSALMEEKLAEGYTPEYTADGEFDRAFAHYRDSYMATLASEYILSGTANHYPGAGNFNDYYNTLELSDLATRDLLGYPYGMRLVYSYPKFYFLVNRDGLNSAELMKKVAEGELDFMLSQLHDDELMGEYMLSKAAVVKTHEGYMDFKEKHLHYFVTDSQRDRFAELSKDIPVPEAVPAVDFRFPDVDGNEVALSDFKGKVVYIDVWATWCGPCKYQIPFLKKLEAEYHDNPDMVFVSVSADSEKDRQKWLDMVESEGLVGIQLFGGDRYAGGMRNDYGIRSIPRFILVGKDGNIINDDAERPSSAEIRPILDAALAR